MAVVTAGWNSWGQNFGGFTARGSTKIQVHWGDGTTERFSGTDPEDPERVDAGHWYASDGVYLVQVKDAFGGPAFAMNAIFFTSDTSDRTITGNGRFDLILAGSGNDTINGGSGNDLVAGGAGHDRIYGSYGDDVLIGDAGDDFIIGGVGSDLLGGGQDNDRLQGGEGTDFIYGDDGNDLIYANGSAVLDTEFNYLDGGSGDDRIFGDAGDDYLAGGSGRDTMSGGAGRDNFDFNSVLDSGVGALRDVITDFEAGASGDTIDLVDLGFLTEIGTAKFNGASGQVRYQITGDATVVQIDLNGDRSADMEIQLKGALALTNENIVTASDFLI